MDPRIHAKFQDIIKTHAPRTGSILEIGGLLGKKSLLLFPELKKTERFLINLARKEPSDGVQTVQGNSNEMTMFATGSFDLVMSNAVLEYDKYFWKSIAEMKRILKPGGLMVIGVPGYAALPGDKGAATPTFKIHFSVDYYQFSPQAVTDVFFEDMSGVEHEVMLIPPRIVAWGRKPA